MCSVRAKVISINSGVNGSLSRSFQKHLDDISGKHHNVEVHKTAILGTAHILRNILTYKFINFKCIFQKLWRKTTRASFGSGSWTDILWHCVREIMVTIIIMQAYFHLHCRGAVFSNSTKYIEILVLSPPSSSQELQQIMPVQSSHEHYAAYGPHVVLCMRCILNL
jgi:hypothetical protein